MTTITAFQPPPFNTFSFQPTLDGQTCGVVVWFNAFASRWFMSVTGQDGGINFTEPLIGSPSAIPIQEMTWEHGSMVVTTQGNHGYVIGSTVLLTVAGCLPDTLNGDHKCLIINDTQFSFSVSPNPGEVTQLGAVSYDVNIGAGYLASSKIVFREASNTFEVT